MRVGFIAQLPENTDSAKYDKHFAFQKQRNTD